MKKILSLSLIAAYLMLPGNVIASDENQEIDELVNHINQRTGWNTEDIHLLAHVVHGEARGEPYIGKVAVAAVVLNRIKSTAFPNTLKEVVYQPRAFSCVADGQIELKPDLDSYRAAFDAILGNDPTGGCLFYYNPKIATSRWMKSRVQTSTVVFGNHIFSQ